MEVKRDEVATIHEVTKKSATEAMLIGTGVGAGVLAVAGAGVGALVGFLVGKSGNKRVLVSEAK